MVLLCNGTGKDGNGWHQLSAHFALVAYSWLGKAGEDQVCTFWLAEW